MPWQVCFIDVLREYNEMKEEIKNHYLKTIETYRVSYKKNIGNENLNIKKTKQSRLMLLSNCAVCGKENLVLIKN